MSDRASVGRVVVVGLGPGPRNTVTDATLQAIATIPHQFLRTRRHPTADLLPHAESFDHLYESLPTFDEVYSAITETLVAAADKHGEVLYAVPGSPLLLETSVSQLRQDSRVEVQVLPAMSFLDLAWEALGIDPVNAGVRLIELIKHLLEETYEVVDALNDLDTDDPETDNALIEELGDLLYQVEFHATIAEQEGRFTLADVARSIHDKLVRRHPHVFGDAVASSANDVVSTWDEVKRQERKADDSKPDSVFSGVAKAAPSLSYATKLQKRAADVGFDWPNADGAFDKIREESAEIREAISSNADPDAVRMELGDLLFSVVNLSRHLGHDAETALRQASDKFRSRFEHVEAIAAKRNIDLHAVDLATLDALWDEAKLQK
ncbi:MAG: nucleoside triphosphate pyrophosphohydrolase [Actinobacteria bacterium]|nr:nucleoside triphosphate pyrophosphohydrolase [Actinomycetota bacterium]